LRCGRRISRTADLGVLTRTETGYFTIGSNGARHDFQQNDSTLTPDGDGNVTGTSRAWTDPVTRQTQTISTSAAYDGQGRVTSSTDGLK
jgi:YD repeat-containing protein